MKKTTVFLFLVLCFVSNMFYACDKIDNSEIDGFSVVNDQLTDQIVDYNSKLQEESGIYNPMESSNNLTDIKSKLQDNNFSKNFNENSCKPKFPEIKNYKLSKFYWLLSRGSILAITGAVIYLCIKISGHFTIKYNIEAAFLRKKIKE